MARSLLSLLGATLLPLVAARPSAFYCHFMVGIVKTYEAADWVKDITLAKATGIDGFALNIGTDDYTDAQLALAYAAAEQVGGFKLFISFDFGASPGFFDATNQVIPRVKLYANHSAAAQYNGSSLVSTFVGDGFNWQTVQDAVSTPIFPWVNYQPGSTGSGDIKGLFNWGAWPNTDNQPINANMTTDTDELYITNSAGLPYMAGLSPWFFTHYAPDSYAKNWLFLSDVLWIQRLEELRTLNASLVEIITWNDYGESHYIGPLHPDDPDVYAPGGESPGAIDWVTGMPHDAWRDILTPYIKAIKAGTDPVVDADEIVYWYRPFPKNTNCSADATGPPTGSDYPVDAVFAAALLTKPATINVNGYSYDAPAGITQYQGPMTAGKPTFSLIRDGASVLNGTGGLAISDGVCKVYNFNAYVGAITGSS